MIRIQPPHDAATHPDTDATLSADRKEFDGIDFFGVEPFGSVPTGVDKMLVFRNDASPMPKSAAVTYATRQFSCWRLRVPKA